MRDFTARAGKRKRREEQKNTNNEHSPGCAADSSARDGKGLETKKAGRAGKTERKNP